MFHIGTGDTLPEFNSNVSLLKPFATLRPNGPEATVRSVADSGGTHYIRRDFEFFSETDFPNNLPVYQRRPLPRGTWPIHLYQWLSMASSSHPQLELRLFGQLLQCLRLLLLCRSCPKHSRYTRSSKVLCPQRLPKDCKRSSGRTAAQKRRVLCLGKDLDSGYEKVECCCRYPILVFNCVLMFFYLLHISIFPCNLNCGYFEP